MFSMRGLLSGVKKPKDDEYIEVSSFIETGSALDRRKKNQDRRTPELRRRSFSEIISGIEKRLHAERRLTFGRRSTDDSSNSRVDDIELTDVEVLVKEQKIILDKINQLSSSAKALDFHILSGELQKLMLDIKYLLKKEEQLLHLSLDLNGAGEDNADIKKTLIKLEQYLFKTSDQVLEILGKHQYNKINAANVGAFLLNMASISKILKKSLEQKESYLYPLYKQLPNM